MMYFIRFGRAVFTSYFWKEKKGWRKKRATSHKVEGKYIFDSCNPLCKGLIFWNENPNLPQLYEKLQKRMCYKDREIHDLDGRKDLPCHLKMRKKI